MRRENSRQPNPQFYPWHPDASYATSHLASLPVRHLSYLLKSLTIAIFSRFLSFAQKFSHYIISHTSQRKQYIYYFNLANNVAHSLLVKVREIIKKSLELQNSVSFNMRQPGRDHVSIACACYGPFSLFTTQSEFLIFFSFTNRLFFPPVVYNKTDRIYIIDILLTQIINIFFFAQIEIGFVLKLLWFDFNGSKPSLLSLPCQHWNTTFFLTLISQILLHRNRVHSFTT